MKLNIKDTFNSELPADPILENARRQVEDACYSFVTPKKTKKPEMLHIAPDMLSAIGLSKEEAASKDFLNVFTGNAVLPNTNPYAMCYGGHQFGNWAGQLGDGRAINLAEVVHHDKRWALQLKGAGETPYSRTADGLAVLRSSIREYLCSEAMHYLGVPTTRALSLALTGDQVLRDVLYDGHPAYEKGAVVCRVAPTFIRFGSFEILASRGDKETLEILVNYTLKHFYSHLGAPSKKTYLQFFKEVVARSMEMVVHWQRVGFVHGVMNTDNMSILGLTIDYGPYGWLEGYDHGWTPNTTDRQHKRYRFGQQSDIVLWNLYQLANVMYFLIDESAGLEAILEQYKGDYEQAYLRMMRSKIGMYTAGKNDALLIKDLEALLQLTETDMTLFFRNLSAFDESQPSKGLEVIKDAFYDSSALTTEISKRWDQWFLGYASRLKDETLPKVARVKEMNAVNPKYVLRNYMAQLAIDAADKGDNSLLDELFNLLKKPYDEQPKNNKWFAKRPEWARNKVGCSMLSCSS
ncbi:MAG: hypothetical protein COA50_16505 [Flavobacteriaceae bacterium]|nr:MAG: hypothetical protein COA50_16505 [Flavobacteriaceae bacterium]